MSVSSANHGIGVGDPPDDRRNRAARLAASVLAFAAFCLLMISLRPFEAGSIFLQPENANGDRLNQVGFLIAGLVAVISMVTLVNRKLLGVFLSPAWWAIAAVLAISIVVAPDPIAATRSVILTLIGMIIAASIVLLPPDERSFQQISAAAILTVMAVSYFGVALLPQYGVHGGGGDEAQHAGLWRGHFSHKNIAGPVMSVFVMFGIYLWRSKLQVVGAIITLLALFFVIQTGSKTTNGFLPLAIFIVLAGRAFGLPLLTVGLYVTVVAVITGLTLGSLYSESWASMTRAILSDPSFTGRTTLWQYGLENIGVRPWFGTGFDSFWGTPTVEQIERPFERDWDFRGIVHGHNNFIDMALTTGIVGFLVLFWALFIAPAVNYVKSCRDRTNANLADLFMMILVFMTLLSFLETFFLRRIDPIWLLMFMAITGLQLSARFRTA